MGVFFDADLGLTDGTTQELRGSTERYYSEYCRWSYPPLPATSGQGVDAYRKVHPRPWALMLN